MTFQPSFRWRHLTVLIIPSYSTTAKERSFRGFYGRVLYCQGRLLLGNRPACVVIGSLGQLGCLESGRGALEDGEFQAELREAFGGCY